MNDYEVLKNYEQSVTLSDNKPWIIKLSLPDSFKQAFVTVYDKFMMTCLLDVTKYICERLPGARIGYVFDGTIILIINPENVVLPKMQELLSSVCSGVTLQFNIIWNTYIKKYMQSNKVTPEQLSTNEYYKDILPYITHNMHATFIGHCFEVDSIEDLQVYLTVSQRLWFSQAINKVWNANFVTKAPAAMSDTDKLKVFEESQIDFYGLGTKFYKGQTVFKTTKKTENNEPKTVWIDYAAPSFRANKIFIEKIYNDTFI
mgnify:CR=1 FL=1